MALMDLLTVGRSLSEARDRPHRFKLLDGALPKFGNSTARATRNIENDVSRKANAAKQERAASETMKTETLEQKPVEVTSMHVFPAGRWTLNPFKAAAAPPAPPTVQGEFSLDKVKPVRNDLSDSDLELVAVKEQPQSAPEPVKIESVEAPVVRTKSLLERARRLFQKGK